MAGLSENSHAALYMVICMVAFTINDAFIKLVLAEIPLMQTLFLRGIFTSACLIVLAKAMGGLRLPESHRDSWLIVLRTLAEIIGAIMFMSALTNMPLANVSAILQVLPLSVTLAGAMFFHEPLGWRRLTAIGVGFFGVLLIVRPGTEGFNIFSVYALLAVLAVTVRELTARRLSRGVPSITVAAATALGVALAAGVGTLFVDWVPVSAVQVSWLGVASLCLIVGYLFSVMAMRGGDISVVAPFRYTGLIAALLLGWLIFGEWPRVLTLLGVAIIVATGVFTLLREQKVARELRASRAGML